MDVYHKIWNMHQNWNMDFPKTIGIIPILIADYDE
jgi:hypothetical protein